MLLFPWSLLINLEIWKKQKKKKKTCEKSICNLLKFNLMTSDRIFV